MSTAPRGQKLRRREVKMETIHSDGKVKLFTSNRNPCASSGVYNVL
jgi:hypothetical protein